MTSATPSGATRKPRPKDGKHKPRPKDRKQQILRMAATLFRERGFHNVSMNDIAVAVDVVPSALYRHFRGKNELLVAALDASLDDFETALREADHLAAMITDLLAVALRPTSFGILWEIESGHLDDAARAAFRERLIALVGGMADRIPEDVATGPGLGRRARAWAMLTLIDRVAYRPPARSASRIEVLEAIAASLACTPRWDMPTAPSPSGLKSRSGLRPTLRREVLLAEAVELFAERGFPNVSLADIGEGAGIAGPSIYNHFASKQEILERALSRAIESLWLALGRALRQAETPQEALDLLLASYSRFASDSASMVTVLNSQPGHLPEEDRRLLNNAYREYAGEWADLLRSVRPELDSARSTALADLTLGILNGLARVRPWLGTEGVIDTASLAHGVLMTP